MSDNNFISFRSIVKSQVLDLKTLPIFSPLKIIVKKFVLFCLQLICGCQVFNNYKNSNNKKLKRNRQKVEIFFVKFQAPFSQKIINIHLYISYKSFTHSIA